SLENYQATSQNLSAIKPNVQAKSIEIQDSQILLLAKLITFKGIVNSGIDENKKGLLKMYDDTITEATVNYHVNLPQIAVSLNKNPLIDTTTYSFSRD
ncbi:6912_t:CDS:2, partial [Funneliformis caledonium]